MQENIAAKNQIGLSEKQTKKRQKNVLDLEIVKLPPKICVFILRLSSAKIGFRGPPIIILITIKLLFVTLVTTFRALD